MHRRKLRLVVSIELWFLFHYMVGLCLTKEVVLFCCSAQNTVMAKINILVGFILVELKFQGNSLRY